MTKDEALRLALEAFGEIAWSNQTQWQSDRAKVAITAIKAALEAKDEPVADFYITKAMAEHIKNLEVDWKICASGNKRPTDKKVVPVFVGDTTPPQQEAKDEPVAWISPTELLVMQGNALGGAKDWRVNVGLKPEDGDVGLYTTPPQRKPLTDEEIKEAVLDDPFGGLALLSMMRDEVMIADVRQAINRIARAIEAALEAKDEPVLWRNAAIRLGEELSSVGPNGYYDMDAKEWLDWAMEQNPRGEHSLPQRTWVGLTDEEIAEALGDEIDSVYMTDFRRVEAKLKEKNT